MSLFTKITTLFAANTHQTLNQIVDQNAIVIFEQEIYQAEQALPQAKFHLAAIMAERKKLQRDNESLKQTLEQRLAQANAALDKNEESLAKELADIIADDEVLLTRQQKQVILLEKQETHLTQQMRKSVHAIKHYQRELNLAKANRHAQHAMSELKLCSSDLSLNLNEMENSLQRIQLQQARSMDLNDALQEINEGLEGASLDEKLKQAGIQSGKPDGEAVLARLKASRHS